MKKKSQYKVGGVGRNSLVMVQSYFPKVTNVVDANKPALIEVTKGDNTTANIKSHKTCALAVACKRMFRSDGVIIGLTTAYIIKGKIAYRYKLGGTTSREITSFDRKAGFDIGFYQLTPAPPSNRLGVYQGNPNRPSGAKKPKVKRFMHFTQGVRTALGSGTPEIS